MTLLSSSLSALHLVSKNNGKPLFYNCSPLVRVYIENNFFFFVLRVGINISTEQNKSSHWVPVKLECFHSQILHSRINKFTMIRYSLYIIGYCWETLKISSHHFFLTTADCSDVWYSGRSVFVEELRLYHWRHYSGITMFTQPKQNGK